MTHEGQPVYMLWPDTGPDHLYPESCPGVKRALVHGHEVRQCLGLGTPDDFGICGWCARVGKARAAK